MKLQHIRHLDGRRGRAFVSATHFCYRDPIASRMARIIRKETGDSVRVVTDVGPGFTHVFVPMEHEDKAREILIREGYF